MSLEGKLSTRSLGMEPGAVTDSSSGPRQSSISQPPSSLCLCARMDGCRSPQRPEESAGSPGTGVKSGCETPEWVLGTEYSLKSSRCPYVLSHRSSPKPTFLKLCMNSQRPACFCLPSTGMKHVSHLAYRWDPEECFKESPSFSLLFWGPREASRLKYLICLLSKEEHIHEPTATVAPSPPYVGKHVDVPALLGKSRCNST